MNCKPYFHPQRQQIDEQIVRAVPFRSIATTFGLSLGSLSRHRTHVRQALGEAIRLRESENEERSSGLLERVEKLVAETEGILATAKSKENLPAATAAINAACRLLELCGRLTGELRPENGSGIHLTLNKTTTTINNYGDDTELARLICEGTDNFNPVVIERLKALAAPHV